MLTYILLGIVVLYGIRRLLLLGSRPAGLPPGPPTEPIFGNLRQVTRSQVKQSTNSYMYSYRRLFNGMLSTSGAKNMALFFRS